MYEEIGRKINHLRKQNNMTLEQLADKLGVTRGFVGHLEKGRRKISIEHLEEIAELFDVDIAYFLADEMTEFDLSKEEKALFLYTKELEKEGITIDQIREWVEYARMIHKNNKK